ncbi:hypothetical protein ACSX7Y_16350 [Lactiplantibacillus plantarum subsp. plantarum]|uniref:hypothetical protein n=1 Tax=Lactiplantibacillus plantarum TaxID=1590 RepID=UPI003852D85F|nr:hypothetical protein [Lactiplantibacillus plantarum]
MNIEEINSEILKVNNYLKKCLWMDFEFASVDGGDIVVAGRIDTSYDEFAINIDFGKTYYLSSLLYWNLNNSKPLIELAAGKEMWEIIDKYQVEGGNYIFKINAEDFDTAPIIIASKGLKVEIINKDPF